ncbi:MAG: cytochrome c [Acidobacteriota bacterium]|nr:cytochrome c [Acidobacteriota bacterium]
MAHGIFGRVLSGAVGVVGLLALPASLSAQTTAQPTFTKDVAPIFQNKCESCHRPDSIAPMSLITFEEARPWARSIRERVASRNMPPWHIDKTVGIQHYKDDRSLSQKEIDTIVAWVAAGSPKGDPKDMPAPVKWADGNGWNYAEQFGGPPDLIIKSPKYTQKAVAMDAWYKPVVETGLTEPRWVRAIEARPGTLKGRKITHHALAFLLQNEKEAQAMLNNADADSGAGLFMEWAVNKRGELMRANTGKLMLPGSKIRWDIHYSAAGEDVTDQVELGIYFYPKGQEPKYRTALALYSGVSGGNRNLDIAPNSINVGQNFHVLRRAGRLENFQPHMHLRGKAMMIEAILPNGQQQVLSYVPNFEFNWMNNYVFDDDYAPLLPKGTILKVTAWHDNTPAKKSNPDPTQWIGWGDRTVDEMAHAWINITYMGDDDFNKEVEARKVKMAATTERQQQ